MKDKILHPFFRTTLRYAIAATALCAAISLPAQAQFTFTLLTPNVTANRGDTVTFQAVLTNNTGNPLYLNNDLGLVDTPLLMEDSTFQMQFLVPTPQPTLPADGLAYTYDLFTISLPSDQAAYKGFSTPLGGSFTLYGGAADTDQNALGRQDFTVALGPDGPAVPEPGTFALLIALGATGTVFARRRLRR